MSDADARRSRVSANKKWRRLKPLKKRCTPGYAKPVTGDVPDATVPYASDAGRASAQAPVAAVEFRCFGMSGGKQAVRNQRNTPCNTR
jgi:hypothetical protein